MFDYLIVGSGPAGTAAALGLSGANCLVLDVGQVPNKTVALDRNVFDLRKTTDDLFEQLVGTEFEGMHNLHRPPMSLKLKAPAMRYVVDGWSKLAPAHSPDFELTLSFAKGGLANAWGAGVYRFTGNDLNAFPLAADALEPFYDELTLLIGIAGVEDDLAPFMSSSRDLLPPLRLSSYFSEMLSRYERHRTTINQKGIFLGRSRLAVLTETHRGRPAYGYENLEFFRPYNPSVYNPAFTMDELVAKGDVQYLSGYHVLSYEERESHTTVSALNLATRQVETFSTRFLILAAGTLGTARIVLKAAKDFTSQLPIMDNMMTCIPLVQPFRIGAARDPFDSSLGQLNLIYAGRLAEEPLQATLYGTAGPLRTDVLLEFPLSLRANLACARYLTPAIGLVMLFYPDAITEGNSIRLRADDTLDITYQERPRGPVERELIKVFRRLGYYSAYRICQFPRIGAGLHYAGCLPMKADPARYETHSDGRLSGTARVYVVDGSVFPKLPAKNLTFTIMANALRVARGIRELA